LKKTGSISEQEETEATELFPFSVFSVCSCSRFLCQALHGEKRGMPVMEQKPGRYWGVIGRQHLPLGKRGQTPEVRDQISQFPNFSFQLLS
jgi:hypothetical protein